jgi:hypothetical protein
MAAVLGTTSKCPRVPYCGTGDDQTGDQHAHPQHCLAIPEQHLLELAALLGQHRDAVKQPAHSSLKQTHNATQVDGINLGLNVSLRYISRGRLSDHNRRTTWGAANTSHFNSKLEPALISLSDMPDKLPNSNDVCAVLVQIS